MDGTGRGWRWAALPVATVAAVDPAGLAPFGPLRFAAITVTVLWATAGDRAPIRSARELPRPFRIAGLLFLAVVGITSTIGLDPLYAWTGTPERHFGALTWVLCGLAVAGGARLRPDRAGAVLLAATAAAAWIGGLAMLELAGWSPLSLTGVTGRPGGPFGSSAILGAASVLLTPAAVGLAATAERRSMRAFAWVSAALGSAALVASGARAAWAAALAILGFVVVLRRRRVRTRVAAKDARARFVRAALLVGAAAMVVTVGAASGADERITSVTSQTGGGGARGRVDEWRVAVRAISQRPVTGTGPEGYRLAFAGAVDRAYERRHGRNPVPDRAHSAPLDVAATVGVPGLMAWVAAMAIAGRRLARVVAAGPVGLAGVAVGVLAYFAQSLLLFPLAELDPLAWLLAGLCLGQPARFKAERHGPARIGRKAAAPIAVALAAATVVVGTLDVVADRRAKDILTAGAGVQSPNGPDRLRPDQLRYHLVAARAAERGGTGSGLRAAVDHVERGLRISPLDPVGRAEHGRLLLSLARRTGSSGDVGRALRVAERQVEHDPYGAATWLRLGLARALDDNHLGARAAWRTAAALAPRDAAPLTNLAVSYARAGASAPALRYARRALTIDPASTTARDVLRDVRASDAK